MTSIEQMAISGVRSFDPKKQQVIDFFKPLTVILGPNGAGKTTIIECLKCATTGQMPPNSNKGKSFVHDPKVIGDTEVKAQIRLKFRAVNKKPMVTIRSFQLTQKKDKTEFKQLEAAIQTKDDKTGKLVSQSHKCAEMDVLLPQCLGVTTAVLENVIFCHQEDVNWPLSDSSTLKKKFDDIFASTRYTKALDSIRKLKKEQTNQLKDYQTDLGALEAYRDNANKLKKDAELENHKIETIRAQVEEIDKQLEPLERALAKYGKEQEKLGELNNQITKLEGVCVEMEKNVKELYDKMENEFDETDEEIRQFEKDFESQLKELEKEKDVAQRGLQSARAERQKIIEAGKRDESRLSALRHEKELLKRKLDDMCSEVYALSNRYKITGYENPPFTDQQVLKFTSLLEAKHEGDRTKLRELRAKHQKEDMEIGSEISQIQGKIATAQNSIQTNDRKLGVHRRELQNLQTKISNMEVDEKQLAQIVEQIKKMEGEHAEKKEKYNLEGMDSQMVTLQKQIEDSNRRLGALNTELKERNTEQMVSMKIQEFKQERTKCEEQLSTYFKEFNEKLKGVNTSSWGSITVDNIDEIVRKQTEQKKSAITEIKTKRLMEAEKNMALIKQKIETTSTTTKKAQKQLETDETIIKEKCGDKDLTKYLDEVHTTAQKRRSDLALVESLKMCYENFIEHAKDNHECYICGRALGDMLDKFIEMQKEKLETTPTMIVKKKKRVKEADDLYTSLQELKPVKEEIERLKENEIPEKTKQLKDLQQQLQTEEKKVESIKEELKKAEHEEQLVSSLRPHVEKVVSARNALRSADNRVATEQKRLPAPKPNQVSFEELSSEKDKLETSVRELNNELTTLRREYQTKNAELTTLSTKIHTENQKNKKKQEDFNNIKHMREQADQIQKRDIDGLTQEMNSAKEKIPSLQEELTATKTRQQQRRTSNHNEATELENAVNEIQHEVSKLRSATSDIKKFVERNSDDEMSKLENGEEKRRIQMEDVNRKEEEFQKSLDSKQEMLTNKSDIKRNIADNLTYRAKKTELEKKNKDLAKLRQQLKQAVASDMQEDDDDDSGIRVTDEKSLEKARKKRDALVQQKATLTGMKATHKGRIIKIGEELENNDKLKDVDKRYRATVIKVKTVQLANEDLDRYYSALDKALMKYHAMKMAEINAIIKELWQKTYRGQDIDTIEIRADAEGGTANRRTYNYRLVMKKADVGLDMRGRCSAGQKVLACLIIRLALAEAFCIDCGVLALDEPTTNLDYDNVSSLADSLQVIISERRKQSNFQLIVITHDEDFVQKLGRSDFVDHYYRISKDPTSGYTQIDRQDFR